MTIPIWTTIIGMAAATLSSCSDTQTESGSAQTSNTFSDELISFPIPNGGSVKTVAGDSYLIFFGEEMYFLMLRGAAEPDDFGRQRTEAARTDATQKQGKPFDDGDSILTIGDISEVTRHRIEGDPVYLFTHSATAESEEETETGYTTIGFGSVDGNAIWFQHTSANRDDHPASVLAFLNTVTFNQGEAQGD